jgi:GC-rich sequence DNA-binding factor
VREEDELGDGDEDLADFTGSLESVPLGRKANRQAAIKLRGEMGEMIEEVEGDLSGAEGGEDEDEEMKRWEQSQIKRGGNTTLPTTTSDETKKKTYRPTPIPQSSTLPSLSAVTSRLSLELSTLQSSNQLDQKSLDHFERERDELNKQESELRGEVEKTEKKSRWFEEFKETVEDWAAFLDEKVRPPPLHPPRLLCIDEY